MYFLEKKTKKNFLILFLIFFIFNFSLDAEEQVNKKITDKIYSFGSNTLENLLGSSEGDTEISLTVGDALKPMGSIMIVRPLKKINKGVIFSQSQINNYYVRGQERQSLNLGFGIRNLSDDDKYFTGYNVFFDTDSKSNTRSSLGWEFISDPLKINGNWYRKISGAKLISSFNERVLNGYDINVLGQIPYFPWANIKLNNYKWDAIKNTKDSEGMKYGGEFYITKSVTLELGIDNDETSKDKNFASLFLTYPSKDRPSLSSKFISNIAFEKSDVSDELLTKVRRINKVVVELEGAVTVKGF